MSAIKAREIRRLLESIGAQRTTEHLAEALREKHLRPEDFSIRDLAEELVPDGREFVRSLGPGKSGGINLLEAGHAIDTAQFANITGQVVYSRVLEAAQAEEFVFSKLVETIPTEFNGERIAGISGIGDEAEVVNEGGTYPLAGVAEDYIDTPPTVKRGMIVPVTKEAIFFDRTGLLLRKASEVGYSAGLNKEKRVIDVIIDENTTNGRYRWRGTIIATYGDNSGTHTWDNLQASNALVDWTDINAAELLLADMRDPNTGEPMMIMADTLIVCPELEAQAYIALNAAMVALFAGGYATSGNLSRTDTPNPIGSGRKFTGRYNVVTSRLLPDRLGTNTSWFLGNPRKAFAYMENWGLQVTQAPSNSEADFTQDIVARYKVSERGATATLEPRYMAKSTA